MGYIEIFVEDAIKVKSLQDVQEFTKKWKDKLFIWLEILDSESKLASVYTQDIWDEYEYNDIKGCALDLSNLLESGKVKIMHIVPHAYQDSYGFVVDKSSIKPFNVKTVWKEKKLTRR